MKTCHIKYVAYTYVHFANKTCHILVIENLLVCKNQPGTMLSSKNHTSGLEGTEHLSDGKIFVIATSPRCPVQTIKAYFRPP